MAYIYARLLSEGHTLLLSNHSDFGIMLTLSRRRGAEDNAIRVAGVVVVVTAVVVHIVEVVAVVGRAQPPVVGRAGNKTTIVLQNITTIPLFTPLIYFCIFLYPFS